MTRDQIKVASLLICKAYADYDGDWDAIQRDAKIKKLGCSKEFMSTHISNKKKRVKLVAAGKKVDRGIRKRESIVSKLARSDSDSSSGPE